MNRGLIFALLAALATFAISYGGSSQTASFNENLKNEAAGCFDDELLQVCDEVSLADAKYPLTKFRSYPPIKTFRSMKIGEVKDEENVELINRILGNEDVDFRRKKNVASNVADADAKRKVKRVLSDTTQYLIHEYSTRLRADRFAKGILEVVSLNPYKILINNADSTYTYFDDPKLELEPNADYDISLFFLTMPGDSVLEFEAALDLDEKYNDVAVTVDPDMKRRFALTDTEFGSKVGQLSISPDGNWVIMRVNRKLSPTNIKSELTVKNLKTGKSTYLDAYSDASWLNKSNVISLVKERKDDVYDVYFFNPSSGEMTLVAEGAPEGDLYWNPTDEYLFYNKEDEPEPKKEMLKRYSSTDERVPEERQTGHVGMLDVSTNLLTQITHGEAKNAIVDFHPKESKVIIVKSDLNSAKWPFYFNTFYEFDYQKGTVDTLFVSDPFIDNVQYSPDGKKLLVTGSAQAFDGIADRSNAPIANLYDKQLFIYDRANGKVEAITADFNPSVSSPVYWNQGDGKIYFLAVKGFGDRVFSYDPKSRKFTELPLGIENVSSFTISDNGGKIAYYGMSHDHIGDGRVFDVKTGKDMVVADPNAERLADIDMSNFERWTFTSSEGTEIEGYAVYPPDFDPNKKYPLIVYYYGGTLPSQFSLTTPYNPQLAASRGYMVYMLNPSGTVGYGQEFSAKHVNSWGKRTAEDIIEGTRKFIEEHPNVDAKKVGAIGASYGGFMTQYLLTLTDIFAAAVSHAGISNVTSYWGGGNWGYSYNAVAASESYPWNNPELFTKQGSLFNADKIHTPLLLLHGSADTNVPVSESIQLYNALKILDRDVELITVDGENHFIRNYAKRKKWNDTYMAWFAKWLQDDPRWWESLYGK